MIQYPFHQNMILTDSIYTSFGGWTGSSTANQRQAAYQIAEMQMTEHLSSFLSPVQVTGTYEVHAYMQKIFLEYGNIQSVDLVNFYNANPSIVWNCTVSNVKGQSYVLDDTYGLIVVTENILSTCSCASMIGFPFKADIAFTSGIPSGTAYQPNMLLALTMAATIALKEFIDPTALEGGAGDAGIEQFAIGTYHEIRKKWGTNIFGNSAVANYVSTLVQPFRHKKAIKL
jgi:hypothetical protein